LEKQKIMELLSEEQLKLNNDFILKLVKDLNKIFRVYQRIDKTDENGIVIKTNAYKKPPNFFDSDDLNATTFNFYFRSDKDGCKVYTNCVGFYSLPKDFKYENIKSLGHLYEKYQTFGTTTKFVSSSYTRKFIESQIKINPNYENESDYKEQPGNWFNFKIPIISNEENRLNLFNDLVYLMEHNLFKKRNKI
jgi:hypothetical protein